MATRAFVDSNVLANWMLIDAAVQEIGDSATELLKAKAGRKYPSYVLLEKLRKTSGQSPIGFGTSRFAVAETIRVILDEYIKRRIDDKGIPYQYWEFVIKQEKLSDQDKEDLFKQVLRFFTIFRKPSTKMILRFHEGHDLNDVHDLIVSTRLSATDAFLVSQAIHGGCTYFVTEDEPLRRLLKKGRIVGGVSAQTVLSTLD